MLFQVQIIGNVKKNLKKIIKHFSFAYLFFHNETSKFLDLYSYCTILVFWRHHYVPLDGSADSILKSVFGACALRFLYNNEVVWF